MGRRSNTFKKALKKAFQKGTSDFISVSNLFSLATRGMGGMPIPSKYPPTFVVTQKEKPDIRRFGIRSYASRVDEMKDIVYTDLNLAGPEIIFGEDYLKRQKRRR